jgi:predicted metal-binding membrane protein
MAAALIATAGFAWLWTAQRMAGMDGGPGTALGSLGWFTGVWATMMAAMMLPSLAPAAAVSGAAVRNRLTRMFLFAAGYLSVWSIAGIGAYGLFELGSDLLAHPLAWHRGGRWLAAGILLIAAVYQLTPLKGAYLSRCRAARDPHVARQSTRGGTFVAGLRNGGWCLGCSWALMAALFALGVMSLVWMALVAMLVTLEKVGPAGRGSRLLGAGVMAVLAAAILAAPHDVPGFVIPASPTAAHTMRAMG